MMRRELLLAMASLALTPRHGLADGSSGPPLWEAVRAPASVTLFGQLSVVADMAWRTEKIERAFRTARLLWLERPQWAQATAEETRIIADLESKAVAPDYSVLDHLGEVDATRLRKALLGEGVAEGALRGRRPGDVRELVSRFADRRRGTDVADTPEMWFRAQAEATRKPIRTEWRSLSDAVRFDLGAPMPVQLDALRLALDELETVTDDPVRLAAWANGDVRSHETRARAIRRRYPALSELTFARRNADLAARIDVVSQHVERQFVCVELRHLVGPRSLPSELWRRGFRVHQR